MLEAGAVYVWRRCFRWCRGCSGFHGVILRIVLYDMSTATRSTMAERCQIGERKTSHDQPQGTAP